jgi:hypothetical protein
MIRGDNKKGLRHLIQMDVSPAQDQILLPGSQINAPNGAAALEHHPQILA